MIGLLEYNWENADHHKQWTLPIFVPGSAELMNMNLQQVEEHPEIAQFFERMSFLPLTKITCMVPPGAPASACTSSRSRRPSRPRTSRSMSSTSPTG